MWIQRAVACLVIAVYAISNWTALAHHAHVHHTRCAEHGELVDVGQVALGQTSFAPPDDATVLAQTDTKVVSSDEHCAFSTVTPDAIECDHAIVRTFLLPLRGRIVAPPAESPHPSRHPLADAPKTSPPGTSSVVSPQPGLLSHSHEVLVCVRSSLRPVLPSRAAPRSSTVTSARSSTPRPAA